MRQNRYSERTDDIRHAAITASARIPKIITPATVVGSIAIITSSIIDVVVFDVRKWGDTDI
jgi:hypothetical protein